MISVAGDAVLVDYGSGDTEHVVPSIQLDQERADVIRERERGQASVYS